MSAALDGISLTVNDVLNDIFTVGHNPLTLGITHHLKMLKKGLN